MQEPRVPQPGQNTFRELYTYHVGRAARYEREANHLMDSEQVRLQHMHKEASVETIKNMVVENFYVKAAISKQQFHTREATKYGLGMIVEALGQPFSTKSVIDKLKEDGYVKD